MYRLGPVQKKILLALGGGLALGLSRNPCQYYKTLRQIRREWKKIKQSNFNRIISRLAQREFLEQKKLPDGSFKLILTKEGRRQARTLSLLGSSINFKKPKHWDGKWRLVIFDIPEKDRIFRSILRQHLRELEFYKLQHSVFISPNPFEKPVQELVRLYCAEPYVRIVTANKIDNEPVLKKYFFK